MDIRTQRKPSGRAWSPFMVCSTHTLKSPKGRDIHYRIWDPGMRRKKGLVYLHDWGGGSLDFSVMAARIENPDLSLFAWDAPGHGRSEPPAAEGLLPCLESLDVFLSEVTQRHGIAPRDLFVYGDGWGADLLAAHLTRHPTDFRGILLQDPFVLESRRSVIGRLFPSFLEIWRRLPKEADGSPEHKPAYPPRRFSKDWSRSVAAILDGAPRIASPALLMCREPRPGARSHPERVFFERLGSPVKGYVPLYGNDPNPETLVLCETSAFLSRFAEAEWEPSADPSSPPVPFRAPADDRGFEAS